MAVPDSTWLAAQRWFRAKHRPIGSVHEIDRAPIGPGALVVLEVAYVDGGPPDRYLVPLVGSHEPADGDGLWAALVRAIGDGADITAARASFACGRTGSVELDGPLDERRLGVEQSNTSVVIGERLILKLFRLLEPGENPDLEVGAFLTDAGFADTPSVAGSVSYVPSDGEPCAAAMLQELVPATGDAWALMLAALAKDPDAGLRHAASIGTLTAGLHRALASRPDDPAFPARPATAAETAAWRASAERQLAEAVSATDGDAHDRLVAIAPSVTARFADSFDAAAGDAQVTRIHGDYHLGQLLARIDGGFSVIDFEGEPARPLAERRLASSPLRDVAGMLRSLDYAARTAAAGTSFDADGWLTEARAAFLAASGVGPAEAPLVAAFELEKACYEVRYEASNRPGWLWLPIAAVERLAA